jgi:ParB family transcriptional regulator, chromosome partitioning protein
VSTNSKPDAAETAEAGASQAATPAVPATSTPKSAPKGGLGRGLDALLPKLTQAVSPSALASPSMLASGAQGLRLVAVAQVLPNPDQPRQHFDETTLLELAESIRQSGVLQPLLVRQRPNTAGAAITAATTAATQYEIVAGERRWRAAQLAGLTEVPVLLRELSDRETLELAIVENLQREDLNPVEEARAFAKLLEFGLSQEGAARAVGKARSTVANALRLLSLAPAALAALETGEITPGHARALLALPSEQREGALAQILSDGLTVRQAEALKDKPAPPLPGDATAAEMPAARARPQRELELALARFTGTRVRLVGEHKGKVELYFHSQEDLTRLLEVLGYVD